MATSKDYYQRRTELVEDAKTATTKWAFDGGPPTMTINQISTLHDAVEKQINDAFYTGLEMGRDSTEGEDC